MQVSDEGLRFDLNLPRAMKPAEISQVEALVNTWIEVCLHAVPAVLMSYC